MISVVPADIASSMTSSMAGWAFGNNINKLFPAKAVIEFEPSEKQSSAFQTAFCSLLLTIKNNIFKIYYLFINKERHRISIFKTISVPNPYQSYFSFRCLPSRCSIQIWRPTASDKSMPIVFPVPLFYPKKINPVAKPIKYRQYWWGLHFALQ